ncbi:MAG: hypothetical protein R3E86_14685 [Pseudomonadales bacterium]
MSRYLRTAYEAGLATALLMGAFLWSSEAAAQDSRERFSLTAGALSVNADAEFSSVRPGRPDLGVRLDDLGADDADKSFIGSVLWNMGDRWVLRLDTFGFNSSGANIAERDFTYDDTTVTVGMRVEGGLDIDIYMVNLGYRFIDNEQWEMGAGLGVHYIRLDFAFEATLSANGDNVVVVGEEETKEEFPVPNLYAWTEYRFNDSLALAVNGGWLSATYGDYDGELYFLRAALEFDFSDRFGVGAGYWVSDFDVERSKSSTTERYHVDLPGPYVYLTMRL